MRVRCVLFNVLLALAAYFVVEDGEFSGAVMALFLIGIFHYTWAKLAKGE